MEQAFAGTGVTHVEGVAALDDVFLHEVVLAQGVNALHADFGRDVAGLQVADQRVDDDAVANFDGDLAQVLMRAVHGVAQLQSGDGGPSALVEHGAGFGRTQVHALVLGRVLAFGQHVDRAGQADVLALHDHLDARMVVKSDLPELVVGGVVAGALVDQLGFPLLVGFGQLVLLGDLHGGVDFAVALEGDFLALFDAGGFFLGHRQDDRDGPEGAVGQGHLLNGALPVGLGHEAFQRREAADADHDQVALFLGGDLHFLEAGGLLQFGFLGSAFHQTDDQAFASMRRNQFGHVKPPYR